LPLLTLCEPGFSTRVGVSKPVGASVAACCATATAVAILAPHTVRTADQYFPAMTMAASPRHIDRTGSRSGRPRQAGRYSPKLALSFKFALSDHGGGSCPARAALISGLGSLGIAAMPRDPFPCSASMVGMTANATRNRAVARVAATVSIRDQTLPAIGVAQVSATHALWTGGPPRHLSVTMLHDTALAHYPLICRQASLMRWSS
jgi:hypothetical protein